jgi:hypothetical protein
LAHSFEGFSLSIISWLHYYRPVVRQNIMAVGACGRGMATKKQRGRQERAGNKVYLSKAHPH